MAKHGVPAVVIEGCARGADRMAGHDWAEIINSDPAGTGDIGLGDGIGIEVLHFPADWERYGRSAGPRRNLRMLSEGKPEAVIAFHRDLASSKGTRHMVMAAQNVGIPVWLPYPQGGIQREIRP